MKFRVNFGEIVRVPHFPGFEQATRKFTQNFTHEKWCEKTKISANLGGGAEKSGLQTAKAHFYEMSRTVHFRKIARCVWRIREVGCLVCPTARGEG